MPVVTQGDTSGPAQVGGLVTSYEELLTGKRGGGDPLGVVACGRQQPWTAGRLSLVRGPPLIPSPHAVSPPGLPAQGSAGCPEVPAGQEKEQEAVAICPEAVLTEVSGDLARFWHLSIPDEVVPLGGGALPGLPGPPVLLRSWECAPLKQPSLRAPWPGCGASVGQRSQSWFL